MVSLPEKVRVSLPAGNKANCRHGADGRCLLVYLPVPVSQRQAFTKADSDAGVPCAVLSAAVARRLFGTTDVAGKTVQLNYVEYRISGVVTDVSVLATSAYAQVWVLYVHRHCPADVVGGDHGADEGGYPCALRSRFPGYP